MKWTWPILLSLLVSAFLAQRSGGAGASAYRSVMTAQTIRSAGLTRVGDILLLIDDWDINTTDGFTWTTSPNGLSTFRGQEWVVMLDGQRIDLKLYDINNLNMLPIALDQIDSVEIFSIPQMHEGEFTDRGLIHIHTTRPHSGISFQGSFMGGNEIGDPGPYRYTEFSTPNVDAVGPDISLALGFGHKSYDILATAIVQHHFFTDLAVRERNLSILKCPAGGEPIQNKIPDDTPEASPFSGLIGYSDTWPATRRIASSLRIGTQALRGRHDLFIGHSFSRKYLLFFKPFGREIPTDCILTHVGIKGAFIASRNVDVAYNLKNSTVALDQFPNTLDVDFEWRTVNSSINMEGNFKRMHHRAKLGFKIDRYALHTDYRLDDDAYSVASFYAELNHELSNKMQQDYSMLVTFSNGKTAVKAAFSNRCSINSRNRLLTHLSLSQRILEENNSLWYWVEHGYRLLEDNDVDYLISDSIDNERLLTADVIWNCDATENLSAETSFIYRYFSDVLLEKQSFQFNPQDCSFSSPVNIYGDQDGHILGARLSIDYRLTRRLQQRLFYAYRNEIAGDDIFMQAWRSVPRHKLSYRFTYTPAETFVIWGMLTIRSSSAWADYENIDGRSCETPRFSVQYSSTVQRSAILDLQMQKWFWRKRLRGDLLCRNVWNQDFRYHPIGASFDLSFYAQFKVFLD